MRTYAIVYDNQNYARTDFLGFLEGPEDFDFSAILKQASENHVTARIAWYRERGAAYESLTSQKYDAWFEEWEKSKPYPQMIWIQENRSHPGRSK